jgi:alkane 1-monooxygenase
MIPYTFFPLLIIVTASAGPIFGPSWGLTPFILILIVIPIFDFLLPNLNKNDDELFSKPAYSISLFLTLPLLILLFGAGLFLAPKVDFLSAFFLGASIGMATGSVGLPAAHELIHQTGRFYQRVGIAILMLCFYGHFRVEHIHGHHLNVATKNDPASARFDENVYKYLFRCITSSWHSAWALEKALLLKKEKNVISIQNRVSFYFLGEIIFLGTILGLFGLNGLLFFIGHTFIAILLLEVVEYIQHYGLERKHISNNSFEPYNECHAWNCRAAATNWSTFNLGLHCAHHKQPGKQFFLLSNKKQLMEMPAGYPIMIMLALVPPIWFRVMNPKLTARNLD